MSDISKIKLASGSIVNLKDAKAREDLATEIGKLKTAAYRDVAAAIGDGNGKIADAATVKAYVDAQIGSINKFDVVIAASLPEPSASTMYKLYLIPDMSASAGTYTEYITIRTEVDPPTDPKTYNYAWEQIGSTAVDLTNYVKKTTEIAGVQIGSGISVADLENALGLKAMAKAATASGSGSVTTADSVTINEVTIEGNAAVTSSDATATISKKVAYTPAGSITGSAISGGSISVTLADATGKTEAELTTADYTPAGTVTGTVVPTGTVTGKVTPTGTVSTTVSNSEASASVTADAYTPEGTVGVTLNGNSFSIIDSVGTLPTKAADTFTAGSFTKGTAVAAATEGITAHVASGSEISGDVDGETLIFAAAATDNVIDYDATYVAPTYTEGTFTQGTLPTKKSQSVGVASTTFTGTEAADMKVTAVKYQKANTTASSTFTGNASGDAITATFTGNASGDAISATFAGTVEEDLKVTKAEYKKQQVSTQTFTPTAATLGFSGTQVSDLIPSEITYKKADSTAAYSTKVTPTGSLTKTSKTVNITVTPDAT